MLVTCVICGKQEDVKPSRAKKYKTCSVACRSVHLSQTQNTRVQLECQRCQAPYEIKRAHAEGSRFCSRKCFYEHKVTAMAGEGNHQYGRRGPERGMAYKGGKFLSSYGYVRVLVGPDTYEFEHRLVMINKLARPLGRLEVVHHKNGVKTDNRPENLELMSLAEHTRLHNHERFGLSHTGRS